MSLLWNCEMCVKQYVCKVKEEVEEVLLKNVWFCKQGTYPNVVRHIENIIGYYCKFFESLNEDDYE
jgi:hypothetical protein